MNASRTARERVRAELTREITEIARRQLATDGAAGLSLRAVAREMGMASSAIYRYFGSRDELLTTLIIDSYNAVGAAVEKAEAACPREDHLGRWLAACQALRAWALAHPHEYALVYGSPVPGYQAPQQTIEPASRVAAVLGSIISDAYRAGTANGGGAHTTTGTEAGTAADKGAPATGTAAPATGTGGADAPADGADASADGADASADGAVAAGATVDGTAAGIAADRTAAGDWLAASGWFAADADRLRDSVLPGVPDDLAARSLTAWAGVFGLVSFELFGQFNNVVTDRDEFFRYGALSIGHLVGLAA